MTEAAEVEYERLEGGVAVLRWNRPDARNALTPEMVDAALRALGRAAGDAEVRAVVLTGAGAAFSAGADLKRMARPDRLGRSALEGWRRGRHGAEGPTRLAAFPKPTIAALHGPVAGMGCAWALACDVVVAGDDTRFHLGFVPMGFVPDSGSSWLLVRRVGLGHAKRIVLGGEPVDASEAERIGLCELRVEAGCDVEAAIELARRIARQPPLAVAHARRVLEFAAHSSLADASELEAWVQGALGETEDHREAVRAFVEKRTPRFRGR